MADDWLYDLLFRVALAYAAAKAGEWMASWHFRVGQLRFFCRYVAAFIALTMAYAAWVQDPRPQGEPLFGEDAPTALQRLTNSALLGAWVGVLAYPVVVLLCFPWVFFLRPVLGGIWWIASSPLRLLRAAHGRVRRGWTAAQERSRRIVSDRAAHERADRELRDQRRRDQARFSCEIEYARFCPPIEARFPRPELNAFLTRYMGDGLSADEVEGRAAQLLALIRLHAGWAGQDEKPTTIDDLAAWFVGEKAKIEALPIEDKLKRYHIAELNERYSDLTSELMRKAKP